MKKERILVNEEGLSQITIGSMVNQIGYETVVAAHPAEAVELLRKESFSVLITDLNMPDIRTIRTEFPGVIILAVVDSVKEVSPDMVALGVDYVTQPIGPEEISLTLNRVLRDRDRVDEWFRKSVELQLANEELKRLDHLKSSFVSGVSEEAQTPMTVIKEFISLMLKGQVGVLTDEQEEYLVVANRNIIRLSNLIDKLLDFSRIEAGKALKLRFGPTRLVEVIEDAHMALSRQIGEKRITVENRLDPETPLVMVDRDRLLEVFINLLGNGMKFTPPGGKVIIDSRGLSEDRDFLRLVVSDTGVGISPEDLPRIFDRFYQGQGAPEGGAKGSGLGLSIAREIIAAHKGAIHAESQKGNGASFFFTLPLFGVNSIFSLMIHPMLEEAERDSMPLSLIQVGFRNQKTQRDASFSGDAWEEVVGAVQKMVRSVDFVVPFEDCRIYILTFNDKKLAKEIAKRIQEKPVYGNTVSKRTEAQCRTYSFPQDVPTREDFLKGCRALLKEERI